MSKRKTQANVDQREALYNDRATGPADQIQLPRQAITRLWGLVVDLDADILKPNPWFPPAQTAEEFHTAIRPALQRHPILRTAEVRCTGRWLHAIVWFKEPVELKTAAEQDRWTSIHEVLMGSLPSDPAAPSLISLTRPVGSTNSKTGGKVRILQPGTPIPGSVLEEWTRETMRRPFETLGRILFGDRRTTPCPYCGEEGSYLDLGEQVGFCYGPCKRVSLDRVFEPFLRAGPLDPEQAATTPVNQTKEGHQVQKKAKPNSPQSGKKLPVITIDRSAILEIDLSQVDTLVLNFRHQEEQPADEPLLTLSA